MRDLRHISFVGPLAFLVATIVAISLAGCAVDHLKMSMDRGVVNPKVEPAWLDHRTDSTNTP